MTKKKPQNKYLYGKAYYDKQPFIERIKETFKEYIQKIDSIHFDMNLHNLIIDLRNEMYLTISEIYQGLAVRLKYGLDIIPERREPRKEFFIYKSETEPCAICGENRIVQKCHVIPKECDGSDSEKNVIYLCPTHHELFDKNLLTKEELEKIKLVNKGKDTIIFFNEVRK